MILLMINMIFIISSFIIDVGPLGSFLLGLPRAWRDVFWPQSAGEPWRVHPGVARALRALGPPHIPTS